MLNLLLVSPKTENSKGGIAVWTDMFLQECNKYNINCILLNIATIGNRSKQGNARRNLIDEIIRTSRIFRNLRRSLTSDIFDVAHINTSCGTFGLIRDYLTTKKIKKKQPHCKRVVHFHCDVQYQCQSRVSRYFLKKLLNISDTTLVLNKRNYNYLNDNYNVTSEVVSNFISNDFVRIEEKRISTRISNAVFVGYVRPEKGIKELYEVAKSFPQISFKLIGESHNEVNNWVKPNNILICGKKDREEIMSELDNADIFIFLSHSEGFSLALMESMSRGLPCIATDVGANYEMLENKGGIIVPVRDVKATIQAIERMQDPELRLFSSKWNIKKVNDFYTVDKVMNTLNKIYCVD